MATPRRRNAALRPRPGCPTSLPVDDAGRELLRRTEPPRYPNGERKLDRDPFTQATWVILGVAALAQVALLAALDLLS